MTVAEGLNYYNNMGENSGMGRTNEKTITAGEMEEGIPTPIKPYPGK